MKCLFSLLLFIYLSANAFGQQINLIGVLKSDNKPVPSTNVSVAGGQAQKTDAKGQFKIILSNDFKEGQRVLIKISSNNWVINNPLDGEWNLPNLKEQNIQTLNIIIVPRGSKALWTHERIEKYVAKLSNEIANLKKEGDKPKPINFSYYLSEWAKEYDFTPDEVKQQFDAWAEVAANSDDDRKKGLSAFYHEEYDLAAEYFDKITPRDEARVRDIQKQLEEGQRRLEQAKLTAYRDLKDSGNIRSAAYKFSVALEKYNQAKTYVSKDKYPNEWAEIKLLLGNAKGELGTRVKGQESQLLLEAAVKEYQEALTVYTYERWPQDWARVQNNLGLVLTAQGERLELNEGDKLLLQAVDACHKAQIVFTSKDLPQQWATTQITLGNALLLQGQRREGDEGDKLLQQAIDTYRETLKIFTREKSLLDWAAVQGSIGNALQLRGFRLEGDEGAKLLQQAVDTFREVLKFLKREQRPELWAGMQNNLGTTLMLENENLKSADTLARLLQQQAEGDKLLQQAVDAFREALTVYSPEQSPQDWARAQSNLALILTSQGKGLKGDQGDKLVLQAIATYREALKVFTPNGLPQQWVLTQRSLADVLSWRGKQLEGDESMNMLRQAATAYRATLQIYNPQKSPQDWALMKMRLGNMLQLQGRKLEGAEAVKLLEQAVETYRETLIVFTPNELPKEWAMVQRNLGTAYFQLQNWPSAAEAYENELKINSQDEEVNNSLAQLYQNKLFNYEKAFELNERWRLLLGESIFTTGAALEEAYFTTGRFVECGQRIEELLSVWREDLITLRAIEIANLLAQEQPDDVPARLATLIAVVSEEKAEFKVDWDFTGTKHFISQHEKLAPYRAWLAQLFAALAQPTRDQIVKGLNETQAAFKGGKKARARKPN